MGSSRTPTPGSAGGIPLVPPSQPTHVPSWLAITGRSAVTSPPGDSSQPSSPCRTGSRLATATTGGRGEPGVDPAGPSPPRPARAPVTTGIRAASGRGGAARQRPRSPLAALRLLLEDLHDLLD